MHPRKTCTSFNRLSDDKNIKFVNSIGAYNTQTWMESRAIGLGNN
jgi:hypothetical protein